MSIKKRSLLKLHLRKTLKKSSIALYIALPLFIQGEPENFWWNPQNSSTLFSGPNWYNSTKSEDHVKVPINSSNAYLNFATNPSIKELTWSGSGTITVDKNFNLAQYVAKKTPPSIIITPAPKGSISLISNGFGLFTASENASINITPAGIGLFNTLNVPIQIESDKLLTIDGGSTLKDQIQGVISGSGNLALQGPLIISGNNTYTGSTTILGGVVQLQSYVLPSQGFFYSTTGTLDMTQLTGQVQTLFLDGNATYSKGFNVDIGSNTLKLKTSTGPDVTFPSLLAIGGSPSKGSPGSTVEFNASSLNAAKITLSGKSTNTYSSPSNIGNTVLTDYAHVILSNNGGFGTNSNISVGGSATLDLSNACTPVSGSSTTITFNNLSGSGTVLFAGTSSTQSGSITIITGTSSFTGTVSGTYSKSLNLIYQGTQNYGLTSLSPFGIITVEGGGTLSWTNNANLFQGQIYFQPNGTISQLGGYVQYPSGSSTISQSGTITVEAPGGIDTNGNTVNWNGTITSSGALDIFVHKDSQGSGQFNYTSPATSDKSAQTLDGVQNKAGTISISGGNPFKDNNAATIIVDGGAFDISQVSGSISIGYLYSTTTTNSGILDLQGNKSPALTTLNVYAGNTTSGSSYSATIKGTNNQFIVLQNGTLTTTKSNVFQNYKGKFTIGQSGGSPQLITPSLGEISSLDFASAGGNLTLTATGSSTAVIQLNPTTPTQSLINNISVKTGYTTTFLGTVSTNPSSPKNYTADLKIGQIENTNYTGTLILSGSNNFNNLTTISIQSGTLKAANSNALSGISGLNLWSHGTLDLGTESISLSQITGMYSVDNTTQASSVNIQNSGVLTITDGSYAFPFYGSITGSGSIVLSGTSSSTSFIGTNTYTGSTTLQQNCKLNTSTLGSTSNYTFSGGTAGGGILTIGSTSSYTGSITVNPKTPATFATNTFNATLSGAITVPSTASFTKIGVGTLTLSASANNTSLQGQLNIYGGTVRASSTSLGSPSNILFAKFNGTLAASSAISYAGTVTLGTSATFDTTSGNITLTGPVIYWNDPATIATTGGSYTGGLTVTGGGIVTLSGTPVPQQNPAVSGQAYNGVTTIINGTLVSNAASLPAFVSNPTTPVTNNVPKTLVFNAGAGQSATFKPSNAFSQFPTVVFLSSGTIDIDTNGNSITANNVIAGSNPTGTISVNNSFIKAGNGTLTLSANNIYSITTQINAGTLQAGTSSIFSGSAQTSGAFGVGSNVIVNTGATIDLNGFNNTISNLSGSGTLTNSKLTPSILTINVGGSSSTTFSGTISGSAGITFSGTQTLTLSGGGTAGALQNTGSGTLIITQPLDVTSFSQTSGILDFSKITLGSLPLTGVIDSSGAASFAGTLKLPTKPPTGTVTLISYSSHSDSFSTVTPTNANLNYTSTYLEWIGRTPSGVRGYWNVNANGHWNSASNWSSNPSIPGINVISDSYEIAEFLNQTGSAITVTVNQEVILSQMTLGDDTTTPTTPTTSYTLNGTHTIQMGDTTYTSPEILVSGALGISHTISAPITVSSNLDILSNTQNASLTISGTITLNNKSLTFTQDKQSPQGAITVSGQIKGTANSSITLNGGTLALTPSNKNTFDSMQISSGTLQINDYAIPSTTAITLTGTTSSATIQPSSGTVTLSSPISNSGTLTLDGNGSSLLTSGTISGSGSIETKGNVTFSGSNSYSGSTTVHTGTLTLKADLSSSSGLTIESGAAVNLNNNNLFQTIAGNGTLNIGSYICEINSTSSFDGTISGTGTLLQENGTLTLSGTNSFSGHILIGKTAILKAGSSQAFGSSVIELLSNSTLNLNNYNNTIAGIDGTLESSIDGTLESSINLGSGTLTIHNTPGNSYSYTGTISGSGGITFSAGSQTISGQNTYTGATLISGGSVTLGSSSKSNAGPLGTNSALTINSGSLHLQSYDLTIPSLAGSGGTIDLGTGSLALSNNSTTTYSGNIAGSGSLTISKGSLTLSGTNSFSGGITIAGSGSLTTTSSNALGSGATLNNGSLTVNQESSISAFTQSSTGTVTIAVSGTPATISCSGSLSLHGTLLLSGSYNGTATLLSGNLRKGFFTSAPSSVSYSHFRSQYLVIYNGSSGCNGVWSGNSGNNEWATSENWDGGCIPGLAVGVDQTAKFNTLAQSYESVNLNSLTQNPVLAGIDFNSDATSYTLLGGTIVFDSTNLPNPQISVLNGSHTIRSQITGSTSTITLYTQIDDGGSLTFGGIAGDPEASLSNFQEFVLLEGTGTDLGNGNFNNYGTIGDWTNPVANISVLGSNLNNYFLLLAGNLNTQGIISVNNTGSIKNYDTILADQMIVSGGSVDNKELISVDAFTINGGTVTNSGLVTTLPLYFQSGAVVNSGTFSTTDLEIGSNFTYTTQLYSQEKYGYIDAIQISLDGNLIVQAMPELTFTANQSFDLIDVSTTYNSKFANISYLDFPSNILAEVLYLSNKVVLNLTQFEPTPTAHMGFNLLSQQGMFFLRKVEQLKNRMIDFSKDQTSGNSTAMLFEENLVAQNTNILERKEQQLTTRLKEEKKPGNFYIAPIGSTTKIQSYKNMPSINMGSVGFITGFDWAFNTEKLPVWIGLGSAFDYEYKLGSIHSNNGSFNANKVHGTVYSTLVAKAVPALNINTLIGYAYSWDNLTRKISSPKILKAKASTGESIVNFIFDIEYLLSNNTIKQMPENFSMTPFINVEYINNQIGAYKESGANIYNLQFKTQTLQSAATMLGSRFNFEKTTKTVKANLELDIAWQYEYINQTRQVHFASTSHIPFSGYSTIHAPARNTALISLDLFLQIFDKYLLEASCDTKWNADYIQAFFYLGTGVQF